MCSGLIGLPGLPAILATATMASMAPTCASCGVPSTMSPTAYTPGSEVCIQTDSWMQTSEPGVYAVGDIVLGTPQLAHVGAMEAIVAVAKIAGKPGKPINPEHIPGATYCHPEIGSVGLTETTAREAGYNVKIGKFPFTANSRASIVGQHEGFIKIVSDADYGEILGVHIIGPQATEPIAEAVTAMELEATVEDLMW